MVCVAVLFLAYPSIFVPSLAAVYGCFTGCGVLIQVNPLVADMIFCQPPRLWDNMCNLEVSNPALASTPARPAHEVRNV
jgi:hypothetical protein